MGLPYIQRVTSLLVNIYLSIYLSVYLYIYIYYQYIISLGKFFFSPPTKKFLGIPLIRIIGF